MKITFKPSTIDLFLLVGVAFLSLIAIMMTSVYYTPAIVWLILLTLLIIPKYHIKGRGLLIFDAVAPVLASAFTLYFSLLINSANHDWLFEGTLEGYFLKNNPESILAGVLLILPIYYLLRAVRVPRRISMVLIPVPTMIMSLTNYIVHMCRGDEFIASDILGAKTALSVVSYYEISFVVPVILLLMPYALYVILCFRFNCEKTDYKKLKESLIYLGIFAVLVIASIVSLNIYSGRHRIEIADDKGSEKNGFVVNFALSVKLLFPVTPDGYGGNSFFNDYASNCIEEESDITTNIIVIMNESYCDPDMFFDDINGDPDFYYDNLSVNCVKGYALSSVYGGRTPNSEFEFLTGITTAYLPEGSIPYSMYVRGQFPSIVNFMNNTGYVTTAMHPYAASGWNRTNVYPSLGFDSWMFEDEFMASDEDFYREFLSDRCAYDNMLNVEEGIDNYTFTFLVTMQNHGGYVIGYDNFEVGNYITSINDGNEFSINNYMTLVEKSNEALEYLINTLSDSDERYVVLMFGDHQPALNYMASDAGPGGDAWYVPYLIWANYELPSSVTENRDEITCLPYLGIDLLNAAGIALPPYYQYINEIRQVIPCINSSGYYSNEAGAFLPLNETVSQDEADALMLYRYLQYNVVFDGRNNSLMTDMLPH